jgi:hypothetical protein
MSIVRKVVGLRYTLYGIPLINYAVTRESGIVEIRKKTQLHKVHNLVHTNIV